MPIYRNETHRTNGTPAITNARTNSTVGTKCPYSVVNLPRWGPAKVSLAYWRRQSRSIRVLDVPYGQLGVRADDGGLVSFVSAKLSSLDSLGRRRDPVVQIFNTSYTVSREPTAMEDSTKNVRDPRFVGIGDLHLDGRLQKYLPTNLNEFILDEVRLVLAKALKQGVRTCVFYGDICDKPLMSYDAHVRLIDLIREHAESFNFLFVKGNHDHLSAGETSLDLLAHMRLPNAKFAVDKPKTFFKNTDHPLVLHPWPHHKDAVRGGATNVFHVETKGSLMDSGRPSPTKIEIDQKCFWVAGHLHTNHLNYSGTIYQTSFGEKAEKFFHIVDPRGRQIKSVPHRPKYRLENVVINSREELVEKIPDDPNTLVKLFVKSRVIIDSGELDRYPNVVKHNSFKTKQELEALVMEDFSLDDVSGTANFDVHGALTDWLEAENVDKDLRKRVLLLDKQLLSNNQPLGVTTDDGDADGIGHNLKKRK